MALRSRSQEMAFQQIEKSLLTQLLQTREKSAAFPPEILTNEEKPGVLASPASNAVMGAAAPPVIVPDSGVVPDYSTVAVMTAGKVEEKFTANSQNP